MGYARQIPAFGVVMLKVVPVILTTLAFSLMFRVVPNRYVPLRHAFIGGVVAAVAFEYMNRTFALYIAHFPTYKLVYGAFASIPIFLLWIYLSWLTVLSGALIAASLSHWRVRSAKLLLPSAQLYYALRILKMMSEGMQSGTAQTLPMLAKQLRIGFDTLEQILEKMAQANIVRKLAGNGWVMIRDAESMQLIELYRLFMFDPASLSELDDGTAIRTWLEKMEQRIADTASVTLSKMFAEVG